MYRMTTQTTMKIGKICYVIFFFFNQNDLHVLLTQQFYKINREKAFHKTMTKPTKP